MFKSISKLLNEVKFLRFGVTTSYLMYENALNIKQQFIIHHFLRLVVVEDVFAKSLIWLKMWDMKYIMYFQRFWQIQVVSNFAHLL